MIDSSKQPLISVVIPVYNVQELLEACVNSVISQTYKNLEIILINDGSTDNSGNICKLLARKDPRIEVLHQENGGLSQARNTGTNYAKGAYIFYLDSDDYISSDCLEKLYNAIIKYDAEIAQANFYYDYPEYLLYDNSLKGEDKVFTKDEAMEMLLKQQVIKNFAWGKLIRSDIAKKYLFPKGKYYEDTFWKFYIIDKCTKYVALGKPMLFYLQRPMSISGTFSLRNLDQLEGEAIRMEFLKDHYPNLLSLARLSLSKKLFQHHTYLSALNKKEQHLYLSKIREIETKYQIKSAPRLNKVKRLISRIVARFIKDSDYMKVIKSQD